jgi:hypothetical protein
MDIAQTVEEHPYVTGAVVFGGGLAILWLFGFFSSTSSTSSTDTATTNMAAAYYAAEAQQATAGTQLNIAQDYTQAQTDQTAIQANAAVAINAAQTGAATQIAASQYNTAGYIANVQGADMVAMNASNNWLGSVQSADAANTAASNNWYALQTTNANNSAAQYQTVLGTIIPQELALSGGGAAFALPGVGTGAVNLSGTVNINQLIGQGYSPQQAQAIAGFG